MQPGEIFILIPCYNENPAVIQTVLEKLLPKNYRIVLIDDGSTKDIYPYLCHLPIVFIRHTINLGQGAALETGMAYARQNKAEIVVHFDADGQHNAIDIEEMIQPIVEGEADIVLGSRFLKKEDRQQIPFFRRFVLKIARFVNGLSTGLWLSDAHNGFRVLNRKALHQIFIQENRQAHSTEILSHIKKNKLHYVEKATQIIYTEYSLNKGQTSLNAINVLMDLIINKLFR